MRIQQIIQSDPEKVYINVKNVSGAVITQGMGVALAIGNEDVVASADGVSAVPHTTSAEFNKAFIGVASEDIADNSYGSVLAWGFADSILLSQETDKTIGLLAGACILQAGGGTGTFTSALAPQAVSTYLGKYVFLADTVNISGSLPYGKGFVRCL